jgi:hypothetical protein
LYRHVTMIAWRRVKYLASDGNLREIFPPAPPVDARVVVWSMLTARTTIERSLDAAEIARAHDAIKSDVHALIAARAAREAMNVLEASDVVIAFDMRTIESVKIMLSAGHA